MTPRQSFDRLISRLRDFRARTGFRPELLCATNIALAFRHLATRAEMAGDPDTARGARQLSRAWSQQPEKTCVH